MTRCLIHGPCLNDLGDLLFFDAWVQPIARAELRPFDLPPLSFGHPVREAWPQPVIDAMQAGGRLRPIGELMWSGVAPPALGAEPTPGMQARIDDMAAIAAEAMLLPLSVPASEAEVRAWLARIDLALRHTAECLAKRGHPAASKQFAGDVTRTFKPGWELAVALVLPAFPRIDRAIGDVEALLAFLADAGTLERRERLLGWPACARDQPARAVVDEVVASAQSFADWVEGSGLASGRGPVELVWAVPDAAEAEALTAVPQSNAAMAIAQLRPRGFAAGEATGAATGAPLMLVSQRPRGYPSF